jgi:acylphosphatase
LARVTYRVVVTGRVQGVSFRVSMREMAARNGVDGWVSNRSDGAVEAVVQGEEDVVEFLIEWAKRGPPGAEVASVTTDRLEDYPHQPGFRIFN